MVVRSGMGSDLVLQRHLQEQGLLDRFEERAIQWAEQSGIRWIELEGELWTLMSDLERKKGVEPGDFLREAGLVRADEVLPRVPPAAIQRLLQLPGVKRASVPTAFTVEGGYALSCGGPGAKAGITNLVRQQVPEWALAGYTLANVPLALSYLMHGRSEVAKATRELTIGTTVDVGKAAAARENAPMAVIPFAEGGDPAVTALLLPVLQAVQMVSANAGRAELKADHAQAAAEAADQKAERALQLGMDLREAVLKPSKRPAVPHSMRDRIWKLWKRNFYMECPCCHKQVSGEQGTMHIDHFYNHENDLTNLWLVCVACNHRMGKPGNHRSRLDQQRFATWQDRGGLQATQMRLLA